MCLDPRPNRIRSCGLGVFQLPSLLVNPSFLGVSPISLGRSYSYLVGHGCQAHGTWDHHSKFHCSFETSRRRGRPAINNCFHLQDILLYIALGAIPSLLGLQLPYSSHRATATLFGHAARAPWTGEQRRSWFQWSWEESRWGGIFAINNCFHL